MCAASSLSVTCHPPPHGFLVQPLDLLLITSTQLVGGVLATTNQFPSAFQVFDGHRWNED